MLSLESCKIIINHFKLTNRYIKLLLITANFQKDIYLKNTIKVFKTNKQCNLISSPETRNPAN